MVTSAIQLPTLISRGSLWGSTRYVPCTDSGNVGTNFTGTDAVKGDYNKYFKATSSAPSAGSPVYVAMNFTAIASTYKQYGLVWIGNQRQYFYNSTVFGVMGTYVIEAHTQSGGTMPTSGWVTLVSVTGNVNTIRSHYIGDWSAYNWLRIRCTAAASNSSNNTQMKIDVYNAPPWDGIAGHPPAAILHLGDSITAKSCIHTDCEQGGAADYLGNMIGLMSGKNIPWTGAGISGWSLTGVAYPPFLPWLNGTNGTWIDDFPGRFVFCALGTNDAADGVSQSTMNTAWTYVADKCVAQGRKLIIPRQFYSKFDSGATSNTWAARADAFVANYNHPDVIIGPDLHTIFGANQSITFDAGDTIHPGVFGQPKLRATYADWFYRTQILGMPASQYVDDFSVGAGVGGR